MSQFPAGSMFRGSWNSASSYGNSSGARRETQPSHAEAPGSRSCNSGFENADGYPGSRIPSEDQHFDLVASQMVDEYAICAFKIAQNAKVICRIDAVFTSLLQQLAAGQILQIRYQAPGSNWSDYKLNSRGALEGIPEKQRWVSVLGSTNEGIIKLVRIMKILAKIKYLAATETYATKREIFYENVTLFDHKQRISDDIIWLSSLLLKVPRSHLNVLASTRGLVAGALKFSVGNTPYFDCEAGFSGINLPQHLGQLRFLSCSAKFVLIVEKESTFQTLLGAGICKKYSCILLTARGYPDLISRDFVFRLRSAGLQIFLLSDGDPNGIEIMMVYRFGCKAQHYDSTSFAVPDLKWIGVHPSDSHVFRVPERYLQRLTEAQRKVALNLLQRPTCLPSFKAEIELMLKDGVKAAIEAFTVHYRESFLESYLGVKLENQLWL